MAENRDTAVNWGHGPRKGKTAVKLSIAKDWDSLFSPRRDEGCLRHLLRSNQRRYRTFGPLIAAFFLILTDDEGRWVHNH